MDFNLNVLPQKISTSDHRADGDRNQYETSLMIPSGAMVLLDCPIGGGKPELQIIWTRILVNATEIASNETALVKKLSRAGLGLNTYYT